MRKLIEDCHFWHIGMGGKRKKNIGLGCNCPENRIQLSPYYHDVLDGRVRNYEVEQNKFIFRHELDKLPKSYRHRWVFAKTFGCMREFKIAMKHWEDRNRRKTKCIKK